MLYPLCLLLFLLLSSPYSHAERVLIPTPENLTALPKQVQIIRDLTPLPWLVVDLPATRSRELSRQYPVYQDVRGRFASDLRQPPTEPNDPLYSEQWHLTELGVPDLWATTQGQGITIALLDSGVDHDHPDLVGNVLFEQGYDFGDDDAEAHDSLGHGTAMAGLMAARCDNALGGCGVAPQAKLIPYKLNADADSGFSSIALATAILAATSSDAQIISMSLVLDDYAPWVEQALQHAAAQGKLLVAAVGNAGSAQTAFPAYLPWVIGVGAVDQAGQRLPRSNYGDGLFISAPGVNLWTTLVGSDYANWFNGSSAATALTSGVLALLVAETPQRIMQAQVVELLTRSQETGTAGWDEEYGFGYLRALPAVPAESLPKLTLSALSQTVYYPADVLTLDLNLQGVAAQQGDLFIRLSLPTDNIGSRQHLYKIWQASDSFSRIPYNQSLSSPYSFSDDLLLPLYGKPYALLGTGQIQPPTQAGIFELSVELHLFVADLTNTVVSTRQILWVAANNR